MTPKEKKQARAQIDKLEAEVKRVEDMLKASTSQKGKELFNRRLEEAKLKLANVRYTYSHLKG